jgi:hypothetical protein
LQGGRDGKFGLVVSDPPVARPPMSNSSAPPPSNAPP